jgi:hypothetical protein
MKRIQRIQGLLIIDHDTSRTKQSQPGMEITPTAINAYSLTSIQQSPNAH